MPKRLRMALDDIDRVVNRQNTVDQNLCLGDVYHDQETPSVLMPLKRLGVLAERSGRSVRSGKRDGEGAAFALFTLDGDVSPEVIHESFRDGQSESGSLVRSLKALALLLEHVE